MIFAKCLPAFSTRPETVLLRERTEHGTLCPAVARAWSSSWADLAWPAASRNKRAASAGGVTTTALTGHLLQATGRPAGVAGNISPAALAALGLVIAAGENIEAAVATLAGLRGAPGRLELVGRARRDALPGDDVGDEVAVEAEVV